MDSNIPTLSLAPSAVPSMSPTTCSESYLDSENLNIALVVDLSFSTYQKEFSSTRDIGDVNGDGKGNTILDAQIAAIQDLLESISQSETLNNDNTEIGLVSFETDAKSHGVWQPLNEDGEVNDAMMTYIKENLRAPTSGDEVYETNNGFTNFDAALDRSVEYFENSATPNRKNLLVFLSDGEPNVRGDGDEEGYCADTVRFWNNDDPTQPIQCSDLGLGIGARHDFCRSDDADCVEKNPYQDCVRGPNYCLNANAVTQYDSEIAALTEMKVERLAIGVGDESNVASGSALWMIDNNPGKELGVLPVQALSLEELSNALRNLCILNTDPPTNSPSGSPSSTPTRSPAPSLSPSSKPSASPTSQPTTTNRLSSTPTIAINEPTSIPTSYTSIETEEPTGSLSPSQAASEGPTVGDIEEIEEFGTDDGTDDRLFPFPPVDPEGECPGDILLVSQVGVTELPSDLVEIISQDTTTVTVSVTQSYTSSNSTIDQMYYQFKPDIWDQKCFEEDSLNGGDSFEITIECTRATKIAMLELWIADDISKNVLSDLDQAVIPDCCYPSTPENTPVSNYLIEIKCKTECLEVVS